MLPLKDNEDLTKCRIVHMCIISASITIGISLTGMYKIRSEEYADIIVLPNRKHAS